MSWTKYKTLPETLELLGQLSETCASFGGPVSRFLNRLVQDSDYASLVDYEFDYQNIDIIDAIYARQIHGLFSKFEDLPLGRDKRLAALRTFVDAELKCFETNKSFRASRSQVVFEPDVSAVFHYAQQKICRMLGDVPSLDSLNFAFGPGANTNVKGALASPRVKLSAPLTCSSNLIPTVGGFLAEFPHWVSLHAHASSDSSDIVNVVETPGKISFVPKNAKTYRTICVEPLLNSLFQKGIGSFLKNKLLHSQIDLSDQTRNQRLARRGSDDGSLATVDLSSASDCISRELVFSLLPLDWALFLDSARTSRVDFPKDSDEAILKELPNWRPRVPSGDPFQGYLLEKFSSMGNGFTFELESMIFYALSYGVCKSLGLSYQDVSVYGDDIIIPSDAFPLLSRVLEAAGFSINTKKSFSSGPFRESCGADYLNGFDIRPFYQKSLVNESTLFTMHNFFFRSGEFQLASTVKDLCNPSYVLTGPDGMGDGHLIGHFTLRRNRKLDRDGYGGGYFDTYILRPREYTTPLPGDALIPLYSVYTRSGKENPTNPFSVRGSLGYAKVSIYTLSGSCINPI